MQATLNIKTNGVEISAELFSMQPTKEYACKSADGRIQALGATPGDALERFLSLVHSEDKL